MDPVKGHARTEGDRPSSGPRPSSPVLTLARVAELSAADRRLGELVADRAGIHDLSITQLSSRALRALEFAGIDDWSAVLELTVAELAETKYLARRQVDEILSVLEQACGLAGIEADKPAPEADDGGPHQQSAASLREAGPVGATEKATRAHRDVEIPEVITAALALQAASHDLGVSAFTDRLETWIPDVDDGERFTTPSMCSRESSLTRPTNEHVWHDATEAIFMECRRLNGSTWRPVLRNRVLAEGRPRTLAAIGDEVGVTRERVRQIETVVRQELDLALRGKRLAPLRLLAAEIDGALGAVTTQGLLESELTAAVRDTSSTESDELLASRRSLLRMLLGRFTALGTLTVRPYVVERLAPVARMVGSAEPEVLLAGSTVDDAIEDAGVPPQHREALLVYLGLRRIDGWYASWRGGLQDKAVAVLAAANDPLSIEEIHDRVGMEANPRSLTNAVQSDKRIRRLGKESYGLAKWGGEEYSGILEELEQAIDRAGGSVALDDVIDLFVDLFGVSAQSVRSYANDRRFVTENGRLRFRGADDPDVRYRWEPIELTPGTSKIDGTWHYRIDVSYDTLRGSGKVIRAAVAVEAGLEPDLTIGFDYGAAVVTFSWSRTQPSLGTIRPVVEALGCIEGDLVFIPLSGPEPRSGFSVRRSELTGLRGFDRLQRELGLELVRGADAEGAIARALGLPSGADLTAVADRLRDRGEDSLVHLLPAELQ